ncbi:MAG: PhzF family phenazine biosynthesis protein [Aureispira sp.]
MNTIPYYLVDVFTNTKYNGNQLAVFVDYENQVSDQEMLQIAKELRLAEITFVKKNIDHTRFEVRIFTQEQEVPFAGHPCLGTAFVINKYLLPQPQEQLILDLAHANIPIQVSDCQNLEQAFFTLQTAAPTFHGTHDPSAIAEVLALPVEAIDTTWPIEEISTGLPYIIVPLKDLKSINQLQLQAPAVIAFLQQHKRYKTNSPTGISSAFFFITQETHNPQNGFHARMFSVEDQQLHEDAATGSANSCFLAYLLKHHTSPITTVVEQGFQMKRDAYIHLKGQREGETYQLSIGGQVVAIGQGQWHL